MSGLLRLLLFLKKSVDLQKLERVANVSEHLPVKVSFSWKKKKDFRIKLEAN